MQTEPEPITPTPPLSALPTSPAEKNLLAPVWHTALIVVIMLGNSYLTARFMATQRGTHSGSAGPRTLDYLLTIGLEFFLLFLVWIGLRLKKRTLRELIGGKWNTPEDFLIDVGIALGFWLVSAAILVGLAYVLRQTDAAQVNDMKQRLAGLIPHSGMELTIFVLLSVIAGLVEEIVFRGYLQQQIGALAGNIYVGLIVSALIFGAGHGYEGTRNMIRIFVFGALFGLLARWRKSLRPGMMAHAFQDSFVGVATFFLSKMGKF
jgi:membrane protease YdiL (CAAX protease family)